jgi:hypothetical protein
MYVYSYGSSVKRKKILFNDRHGWQGKNYSSMVDTVGKEKITLPSVP